MSERERWYFFMKKVANLSLNKSILELKVDWPSLCDHIWSNLCLLHPAALACREYWEPASGCFLISDNKVVVFWQKGCRKLKTNFIRFCQLQRRTSVWIHGWTENYFHTVKRYCWSPIHQNPFSIFHLDLCYHQDCHLDCSPSTRQTWYHR